MKYYFDVGTPICYQGTLGTLSYSIIEYENTNYLDDSSITDYGNGTFSIDFVDPYKIAGFYARVTATDGNLVFI